jgi:multicomponent K+:H+ antiporter subunit G
MSAQLPIWVEWSVALLLALSGVFTLSAAIGVMRFKSFFQRMHPPALAFSFSAWCVTLATIIYFSVQGEKLALNAWLIIIFLSLTVPVTTILLARTELFRRRTSQDSGIDVIPPSLIHDVAAPPEAQAAQKAQTP